jgi:tripeptide aminopeptidase
MTTVLDRFLRYVRYDTQSNEASTTYPSTDKQLVLLRDLAAELTALGLADAAVDQFGYVTATIPATTTKTGVPTIGFIAHVDTSPEMPGAGVVPIVHRAYDGRDLVLPDDPTAVLRLADNPPLAGQIGHDIVTASGTTLLGADNKAGVAEIVTAAAYLVAHPEIAHGAIRIAFTPDEEVGRGTDHFDVATFGALCAYTMDGGSRGEIEDESFSADAMTVVFHGFNTHPGYAKGRMVNAIKVAAAFIDRLPHDAWSPETTSGHDGFVHPYVVQAGVERTSVRLLVRDFVTAGLQQKEAVLERFARDAAAGYPGARVECVVEESYRNMKQVLDRHPEVAEHAREAIRRAGLEPRTNPIRGGTDGCRLSFMGLPTPNLFAGEHNFHSRLEWVSVQDMEKAVEVIVHLCQIWEEQKEP